METVALLSAAAAVAGAIASIAGFGIGSILTPLLAVQTGTKIAVALVSLPHLAGTALRFWRLRQHVDRRVLFHFGLTSAGGGLAGALLHGIAGGRVLTFLLGALLVFAGLAGFTGISEKLRFGSKTAWVGGALSGMLGGLVGNQGGIRSAALLAFDVPRYAFVATATAIGLIVDAARIPIYFATVGDEIRRNWPLVSALTAGVLAGTLLGERVLRIVPEQVFRRAVSLIILVFGAVMLVEALARS
jgi:uncharacterized membrane protein YfcA